VESRRVCEGREGKEEKEVSFIVEALRLVLSELPPGGSIRSRATHLVVAQQSRVKCTEIDAKALLG
jgi:hypothetical protein